MLIAKIRNQISSLKQRHGLRKIVFNTGWLLSDRVLRMAASLIVGAWVARYLSAQQFGLLNYATAWVNLFGPIASLGIDNLIVRDLVANKSSYGEILGTTFFMRLSAAAVCFILAIASVYTVHFNEPLTISLVAILSGATFFRALDVIDLWFQSQVQAKYTVIAKNIVFVWVNALKVFCILAKAPLIAFAWIYFLEFASVSLSLWLTYRKRNHPPHVWRWNSSIAKNLLREGWPLLFSALSIMVYMKIDAIMLKQMIDDRAVGLYSAAVKISEVAYLVPMVVMSSVSPAIYAAKQQSETLYYERIGKLLRFMVISAIGISLVMTFISQTVINILFGSDYQGAGFILSIHTWACLFVFVGGASQPWFVAEGLTKMTFYQTLLGAIVNVILNLYLIPKYAGVGAAIATVIAYGVSSILANATLPQTHKIFKIQMKSLLLMK